LGLLLLAFAKAKAGWKAQPNAIHQYECVVPYKS